MSRYGTRFSLGDRALSEVAAQRGQEVEQLRLMLAVVERERDEALQRVRALEDEARLNQSVQLANPPATSLTVALPPDPTVAQ